MSSEQTHEGRPPDDDTGRQPPSREPDTLRAEPSAGAAEPPNPADPEPVEPDPFQPGQAHEEIPSFRKPTLEQRRLVDLRHPGRPGTRRRDAREPDVPAPLVPRPTPAADHDRRSGHEPRSSSEPTGRRRLLAAFWPIRASRGQLVAGLLLFALGLGLAIQVRTNTESDPLRGAREGDLVRVLDELTERTQRLEDEKHRLQTSRDQLHSSSDRAEEARAQTEQRAAALAVLAGTVPATGPGITLTITDPQHQVGADTLLDTLQELRAAGAEVIQINDVRVVASTWFGGGGRDPVTIDGRPQPSTYVFRAIGSPQDLQPALNIPGGVIRTLEKQQAQAVVVPSQRVVVDALRPAEEPGYARSAPATGSR